MQKLILLCAILVASQAPAAAYKILTNQKNTGPYEITTAMHRVLSETSGISLEQVPTKGSNEALPMLGSADGGQFSIGNAIEMALAFHGSDKLKIGGKNILPATKDIRLVTRGPILTAVMLSRKDGPIKSLADLKGKRVPGEFSQQFASWINTFGFLASAGLSWSDVNVVPVKNSVEAINALIENRVDAAVTALDPRIANTDERIGINYVSLDCSAAGVERVKKVIPGVEARQLTAGGAPALKTDSCALSYDLYIVTHANVSNDVVKSVTKALYENGEKLKSAAPIMRSWSKDRAVANSHTIPYHPGAIDFYRSAGKWTPEAEKQQTALLGSRGPASSN